MGWNVINNLKSIIFFKGIDNDFGFYFVQFI